MAQILTNKCRFLITMSKYGARRCLIKEEQIASVHCPLCLANTVAIGGIKLREEGL